MSEYYYTLHDGDTDYAATTIPSIEGERISQFGVRIVAENDFDGRTCVVYPFEDASSKVAVEKKVAFARAAKVTDLFQQQQHGSVAKPFRVELQPPQQDVARSVDPDDLHTLADFARSQLAAHTVSKAMSQASGDFAADLLLGRGITCEAEMSCDERGTREEPTPFVWTYDLKDASTVQRSEHQATQDVKEWALKSFGAEFPFYIEKVTGENLPKIDGNHKSATGKSDLCVGNKTDFELYKRNGFSLFDQAMGLIEIKTDQYPLKIPQMQLQLASLSTRSRFGWGVVLMGTDGNSKWTIFRFSQHNTISHRVYSSGRKCLEDFQCLLSSIEDRVKEMNRKRIKLQSIRERDANARGADIGAGLESSPIAAPVFGQEQDLCGFEGQLDNLRDRAIENELFLRRLAEYLGDLSGDEERPEVPKWALARNTCHSYYS